MYLYLKHFQILALSHEEIWSLVHFISASNEEIQEQNIKFNKSAASYPLSLRPHYLFQVGCI